MRKKIVLNERILRRIVRKKIIQKQNEKQRINEWAWLPWLGYTLLAGGTGAAGVHVYDRFVEGDLIAGDQLLRMIMLPLNDSRQDQENKDLFKTLEDLLATFKKAQEEINKKTNISIPKVLSTSGGKRYFCDLISDMCKVIFQKDPKFPSVTVMNEHTGEFRWNTRGGWIEGYSGGLFDLGTWGETAANHFVKGAGADNLNYRNPAGATQAGASRFAKYYDANVMTNWSNPDISLYENIYGDSETGLNSKEGRGEFSSTERMTYFVGPLQDMNFVEMEGQSFKTLQDFLNTINDIMEEGKKKAQELEEKPEEEKTTEEKEIEKVIKDDKVKTDPNYNDEEEEEDEEEKRPITRKGSVRDPNRKSFKDLMFTIVRSKSGDARSFYRRFEEVFPDSGTEGDQINPGKITKDELALTIMNLIKDDKKFFDSEESIVFAFKRGKKKRDGMTPKFEKAAIVNKKILGIPGTGDQGRQERLFRDYKVLKNQLLGFMNAANIDTTVEEFTFTVTIPRGYYTLDQKDLESLTPQSQEVD